MVNRNPSSSEWYSLAPLRMIPVVPEWFTNDRRVSAVFVLFLVVATAVFGR